MNTALMKLIKDYHIDSRELWIALNHTGHDPFGDNLQRVLRTGFVLTTNPKANRLPYLFTQLLSEITGDITRSKASWFKHNYLATYRLRLNQLQWEERRFTSTGGRFENNLGVRTNAGEQLGHHSFNGQL